MNIAKITITVEPRFHIYISCLMTYIELPVKWAFRVSTQNNKLKA